MRNAQMEALQIRRSEAATRVFCVAFPGFSLNSTFASGSIKAVRMSEERFCICSCEHCGGHIEFPASGVGMRVACPHCAIETVLTEAPERAAGTSITSAPLS